MIVSAAEIFHIALLPSASGDDREPRETVLVRLESAGKSGWGEATVPAAPREASEWAGGAYAVLARWLLPEIVGQRVLSANDLAERFSQFRGHAAAKSAIDCAWCDLKSRLDNVPLWKMLGGARDQVASEPAFGPRETIDELLEHLSAVIANGCRAITLQLRPGWGLEVVRAVRVTFADLALRVDFGGSATLDQRDLLFRLQDYQVEAIEQPLNAEDLVGHAMLQENLRVPICLRESVTSATRAEQALDVGACRQIRVSPSICGGLHEALEIASICRQAGATCLVSGTAATEIGQRHALALATNEVFQPSIEFNVDDMPTPFQPTLALWQTPGIGVTPDESLLKSVIACVTFPPTPDPRPLTTDP